MEILPQVELTLNLFRPYADLPTISARHGIFREPYVFLTHPIAPCGTVIVVHNTRRETWDNFGLIGFNLGPSLSHYRSYRCLNSDTDEIRISDNIILYPAPLVVPGASRFDQLLSLTVSPLPLRPTTPPIPLFSPIASRHSIPFSKSMLLRSHRIPTITTRRQRHATITTHPQHFTTTTCARHLLHPAPTLFRHWLRLNWMAIVREVPRSLHCSQHRYLPRR
jgi:hypothetical protein